MPVRPLQVVFASVAAGGGHHTVRDALLRATQAGDPMEGLVQARAWTARAGFDRVYRFCVKYGLQGWVYSLTTLSIGAWVGLATNLRVLRETVRLLRKEPPDVVVSTHLVLTAAFVLARWWVGAPTRVVNVIPDYGPAAPGFFPRWAFLRADATWVNGVDTLESIEALELTWPREVQLLGTLVAPAFSQVRAQREAQGPSEAARRGWLDTLAASAPQVRRLERGCPTVAFYGGSGFAGAARPVIDALLARDDLGVRFNLVVLAGRDGELEASLQRAHGHRRGFAAVGFLPPEALAALYALTDVPVMGSLAHSTLQEMLETGTGPLLVYRVIPGTEPPYLDYLVRHRLGCFQPDTRRMVALVQEALGLVEGTEWASLADGFLARAWTLRDESRERAGLVVDQLRFAAAGRLLAEGKPSRSPESAI